MNRRAGSISVIVAVAGVLGFGGLLVHAAGRAPGGAPQGSPDMPALMRAIGDATKIKDPAERVEVLKRLARDNAANPTFVTSINRQLMSAYAEMSNDEGRKEALRYADLLIQAVPADASPTTRGLEFANLASALMKDEGLLREAEALVKKGLAATGDDGESGARQAVPPKATANQSASGTTDFAVQFAQASCRMTLAAIYLKQGRTADAERVLKTVYASNLEVGYFKVDAAGRLAELSEKAGHPGEAMEYLTVAALTGPSRRPDIEAAWRKSHGGSLDGLDAMLDARYEKEHPLPIDVKRYERTAARADRVVLAEIFTGAGCAPCIAVDVAFDAVLARYSGNEVAVLMYHVHAPNPDPIANPSTRARSKFYGVTGAPTLYIDGEKDLKGGGRPETAGSIFLDRYEPTIERRLETKADIPISFEVTTVGSRVDAKVHVGRPTGDFGHLKLQIALVEERVSYTGSNGVRFHPMVVRQLAGQDAQGFPLPPGQGLDLEHRFDLARITADNEKYLDEFGNNSDAFRGYTFAEKKHDMNPKRLLVVAFVQDEDSKKVLQAVSRRVSSAERESEPVNPHDGGRPSSHLGARR